MSLLVAISFEYIWFYVAYKQFTKGDAMLK